MKACSAIAILMMFIATSEATLPNKTSSRKETNLLEQTSQSFTQIAKKAMPATVFIKAQIQAQGPGDSDLQGFLDPYDDIFRRFFGFPFGQSPRQYQQHQPQPQPQPQTAGGSGFFISSDGFIVTNNHVVRDASSITVVLNDGREFPATVSGTDSRTDLALLKIDATDLPYLSFGDSEELDIGEWVVAIGTPFALESSLTVGVVSAKGRQDLGITPLEDFIQTDAAINPGNSGGPLLNLEGDVVGVNTAIFSRSGGYMGIGFSIPSRMAQHVIDQIINQGSVQRAYLGVMLQPIDKELSDALGLDKQDGVLISEVLKNSPAEQGGLLQGDVIVQYNGKVIKNVSKLRNEIALMEPGTDLRLNLLRNNKPVSLSITLGMQNEQELVTGELLQKIGLDVENLTQDAATKMGLFPQQDGVLISKIKPSSPAQQAGLRPGYLITGIAGSWNEPKPVKNVGDFTSAIKDLGNRKHIILIVRHQNYQRYYTLKIQ